MPRLERRAFSLPEDRLPEGRYSAFAVTALGEVVYLASLDERPLIRIADSTGADLGGFGRTGDGPGEFRLPIFTDLTGDTLRILDSRRAKLISVRLDGKLIRERPAFIGDIPLAWHRDSVDHWMPPLSPNDTATPQVLRSRIGERKGRVLVTADDSVFAAAIVKHGDNAVLGFPYAAWTNRLWIGDPWEYRIRAYNAAGHPVFTITPDVPQAERGPITLARAREQLRKRPKYVRGPKGEAIRLPDASARLDTLERERVPALGGASLQVDLHGRLWVLGRTHDSTSVDLFHDSTYLGRAMLPCLISPRGTTASVSPGWLALECDIEGSDWPTELQLYRIVER